MKQPLTLAFAIALVLIACQKDPLVPEPAIPVITPPPPTVTNYQPLTTGSYWIYDWYRVDSLGNETLMNRTDSVYIAGEIIIGKKTYAIQEGTWFGSSAGSKYLRYSNDYLVDPWGNIYFSATNFTDTFKTDIANGGEFYSIWKMDDIGKMVTVPAGTWPTRNYKRTITNVYGTFCFGNKTGYTDKQYADNVGLVRETFFYIASPCWHFEKRLVRYYINRKTL